MNIINAANDKNKNTYDENPKNITNNVLTIFIKKILFFNILSAIVIINSII